MGDETGTIEAGSSYRLEVETEAESPAQNGAQYAGRNHFKKVAIILLGAGTVIAIWRALVSPDKP